jgi:hypothetical protein
MGWGRPNGWGGQRRDEPARGLELRNEARWLSQSCVAIALAPHSALIVGGSRGLGQGSPQLHVTWCLERGRDGAGDKRTRLRYSQIVLAGHRRSGDVVGARCYHRQQGEVERPSLRARGHKRADPPRWMVSRLGGHVAWCSFRSGEGCGYARIGLGGLVWALRRCPGRKG